MEMKRNCFTLVELLITIAVIAILSALLLPALNSAKEKAETIRCVGNIRQVGTFLMLYTEQNDGIIPMYNGNQEGFFQGKWIDCAYSIYRNLAVLDHIWLEKQGTQYAAKDPFRCPRSTISVIKTIDDLRYIVARHFGMNNKLCNLLLTKVATPSQKSMLFDMDQPGLSSWANPDAGSTDKIVNRNEGGLWRHYNYMGINVFFADGHVSGMRESAIRTSKTFW